MYSNENSKKNGKSRFPAFLILRNEYSGTDGAVTRKMHENARIRRRK